MSMPPLVKWSYKYNIEKNSEEENFINFFSSKKVDLVIHRIWKE